MNKTIGLLAMAFVGATVPFTLTANPAVMNAEGELGQSEVLSVESEPLEIETESIADSTIETEEGGKVDEEIVVQVEEWIKDFQKTKVYSLIVDAVLIVYTLWGVLDKILTKTNAKKLLENSDAVNKLSADIKERALAIEMKAKEIQGCYEDTKQGLAENSEELKAAISSFNDSIKQLEEVAKSFESVKKALLEMCKNDSELVKNGAYKKILAILNGVNEDEK